MYVYIRMPIDISSIIALFPSLALSKILRMLLPLLLLFVLLTSLAFASLNVIAKLYLYLSASLIVCTFVLVTISPLRLLALSECTYYLATSLVSLIRKSLLLLHRHHTPRPPRLCLYVLSPSFMLLDTGSGC